MTDQEAVSLVVTILLALGLGVPLVVGGWCSRGGFTDRRKEPPHAR